MAPSSKLRNDMPWWRYPIVWLVIAGPAVVVVASMATLVLAVHGGDQPLNMAVAKAGGLEPATQARNHAAAPHR